MGIFAWVNLDLFLLMVMVGISIRCGVVVLYGWIDGVTNKKMFGCFILWDGVFLEHISIGEVYAVESWWCYKLTDIYE